VKIEDFNFPDNLLYTTKHLWVKVEDKKVRVGITDLGQSLAKEIIHVDLPLFGQIVKKNENIASFETIKAVIKLPSPLSGKILDININLLDKPEIIHKDPYGSGWLFTIQPKDPKEIKRLMRIEKASKIFEEFIKKEREKYGA
jgi:glycine cleavage system H protein